ncbi:MAG: hypothetical protein KatS3mg077_1574 [Candidatus Binatia bacterium]|nr:MAG: hypothetical protein KatS3mg077_1574 [Candidatus Binatia bacterium]
MAERDAENSAARQREEQLLLDRARRGDRNALERLLLRYQNTVYRFGMRMCGHPDDAEDVAQDTLLAAAKSIAAFRGDAAFSSWLYRIARSYCTKKRRQGKFTASPPPDTEGKTDVLYKLPDAGAEPEEHLNRRELEVALNHAVAALPARFREVFVLRDIEGLSTEETAKILELQPATVKTRLHRARMAVRDALAPLLHDSPHEGTRRRGCPDVALLLSKHLEGELSPRVCARMERHLERCADCRETCNALRQLLAFCRQSPAPQIPREVEENIRAAIRQLVAAASHH